jgi:hypothetical protein
MRARDKRLTRHSFLALAVVLMVVGVMLMPRISEPPSYHCFADARSWLGVPNTLNVLSNFPFAVVGMIGLVAIFGPGAEESHRFVSSWERWPYVVLFTGSLLTSIGSAYYHLAPDNARLVWDRLPMTMGFMALLSAMLSEHIGVAVARRLFVSLLAAGAFSVLYWSWTERQGVGDLRLYGLVQFGSILVIVLLLLMYRGTYTGVGYLVAALVTYAGAIGLDRMDHQVFAIGHIMSGHTLKHLIAAAAVGCLVVMLHVRSPIVTMDTRNQNPNGRK